MADRRPRQLPLLAHRAPLVGRDDDVAAVLRSLDDPTTRLLTIVGLGGIGKTRVALEVAARSEAPDAIVLELAAVADASEVVPAIAAALELPNAPGGSDDEVATALGRRPTLLVLDNLEQVVGVQELLAWLLAAVPSLTVLGTSRLPLGMAGERLWRLGPLSVPDDERSVGAGDEHGSVQLFRAVAEAADGRFVLDDQTLDHVVSICRRLGGHPLAIELAASRSARLGPAALRRELERGDVARLGTGRAAGDGRDRDLESTVRWSTERLAPAAQQLFRHLTVFESWMSLELVESFVEALDLEPSPDVFEALEQLVDHHLLEVSHGRDGSVFRLLPPVRDVASSLLVAADDRDAAVAAHDAVMHALASEAIAGWDEPGEHRWIMVLDRSRADLAAALDRAIERGDPAATADLGGALAWLWSSRRVFAVHHERLERAAAVTTAHPGERGAAERLHGWRLDLAALAGASAARLRHLDADGPAPPDDPSTADAFDLTLAIQRMRAFVLAHDLDTASQVARDALRMVAGRDDRWTARVESLAGMVANMRDDLQEARRLGLAALSGARRHGDDKSVVRAAMLLSHVEAALHHPPSVTLDEAHAVARRLGEPEPLEWLRPTLALDALRRGDVHRAAQLCAESFTAPRWGGIGQSTACAGLMVMICAQDRPASAARVHGMLSDRWRLLESHLLPSHRAVYTAVIEDLRRRLGPATFDDAVRAGSSQSWPAAVEELALLATELATDHVSQPEPAARATAVPASARVDRSDGPGATPAAGLTARELEVLRHLAAGGTNKDIGAALGMRSKTVMHHVASIFRKLGVHRRTEAAAMAHRLGLLADDGAPAGRSS